MKRPKRLDELRNGRGRMKRSGIARGITKVITNINKHFDRGKIELRQTSMTNIRFKEDKHNIMAVKSARMYDRLTQIRSYLRVGWIMVLCLSILIGCSIQIPIGNASADNTNKTDTIIKTMQSNHSNVTPLLESVQGYFLSAPMLQVLKNTAELGHMSYEDGFVPLDDILQVMRLDVSKGKVLIADVDKEAVIKEISYFTNLISLDISGQGFKDIAALSTLTSLYALDISENQVRDIAVISNMENLLLLHADHNRIRDISPLALDALPMLVEASLLNNEIILSDSNIEVIRRLGHNYEEVAASQKVYLTSLVAANKWIPIDDYSFGEDILHSTLKEKTDSFQIAIQPVNATQVKVYSNEYSDCSGENETYIENTQKGSSEQYIFTFPLTRGVNEFLFCLYNDTAKGAVAKPYYKLKIDYAPPAETAAPVVTTVPVTTQSPVTTAPISTSTSNSTASSITTTPASTTSVSMTTRSTTSRPATTTQVSTTQTTTPHVTTAPATTVPLATTQITTRFNDSSADSIEEQDRCKSNCDDKELEKLPANEKPEIPNTGDWDSDESGNEKVSQSRNESERLYSYSYPYESFNRSFVNSNLIVSRNNSFVGFVLANNNIIIHRLFQFAKLASKLNASNPISQSSIKNNEIEVQNETKKSSNFSAGDAIKKETNHSNLFVYLQSSGLNIDLPVYQTTDNDHYLKHDRYGNSSRSGELFMDYKYTEGDQVGIIYGHHMRDGSMFAPLLGIAKKGELPIFRLVGETLGNSATEKDGNGTNHDSNNNSNNVIYSESTEYEIIGAFYYDTKTDYFDYTKTRYDDLSVLTDFVSTRNVLMNAKAYFNANKNTVMKAKTTKSILPEILLLSTCNYDGLGNRFVVVLQSKNDKWSETNNQITANVIN